ncbi:MAG: transcriptional regulator [Bacillota bacterium]
MLEAQPLWPAPLSAIDIPYAFGCDLMSDVLAFARPGSLLLTGLTHPQVIRTAELIDSCAIIFVRGKRPAPETVELAKEKGIPLLVTPLILYNSCGRLHAAGVPGGEAE